MGETHKTLKSNKITDCTYIGILALLFVGFAMFFYRQIIRYNGAYISDTIVYAQGIGNPDPYRMATFLFSRFYALTDGYYLTAIFMSAVVIATILANYYLLSYILRKENTEIERWVKQFMSLVGLVCTAIYLPGIYEHFYMQTWPRYAWHSPTQQAMVLFSCFALIVFLKIYENYLEKISLNQWLALVVLLFLSVWAKPAFMMVFAPTVIIIFVADLIRRRDYSFAQRLKQIIALGLAFIPAGLYTLSVGSRQASSDDGYGGVIINIGYFLKQIDHPALMIFLSLAFPLVVFVFNYKKLKDIEYQIIAGITLFGIGEYMVITESGPRMAHGNFGWGREVAEYILFLAAIALALVNFKDKDFLKEKPKLRRTYFIVLVILLAAHALTGLIYLQYLIRGHLYRM